MKFEDKFLIYMLFIINYKIIINNLVSFQQFYPKFFISYFERLAILSSGISLMSFKRSLTPHPYSTTCISRNYCIIFRIRR